MKPIQLLPILVIALVLATAWAGYNLAHQASAASSPPPPAPILAYDGLGSYDYVATLTPNNLTNSTVVAGPNSTLFPSITRWVNISLIDSLSMTAPASVDLTDRCTTTLSTALWSKPLAQQVQQNRTLGTTQVVQVDRYDLNVSWVENLTQSIDRQLGYSPAQFTVTVAANLTGSVSAANESAPVDLHPFLNLTFSSSYIVPSGESASSGGTLRPNAGSADPGPSAGLIDAVAYLLAAVAALVVSVLYWNRVRRRPGPSSARDLGPLIEPFEEIIAEVESPPEVPTTMAVRSWEDLVKVADTLGRPILRPAVGRAREPGVVFYVVDGTVAYEYCHGRSGPPSAEPEEDPPAGDLDGRDSPEGVSDVPTPSGTPRSVTDPGPGDPVPEGVKWMAWASEQLRADIDRIHAAPLSPPDRDRALDLVRTTARAVRSARPAEIPTILDRFHRRLEDLLRAAPPR